MMEYKIYLVIRNDGKLIQVFTKVKSAEDFIKINQDTDMTIKIETKEHYKLEMVKGVVYA